MTERLIRISEEHESQMKSMKQEFANIVSQQQAILQQREISAQAFIETAREAALVSQAKVASMERLLSMRGNESLSSDKEMRKVA